MSELIRIAGKEVVPGEYKGQRVLTLRPVDELHEKPKGSARVRFSEHKAQLTEGEDYFMVPYDIWSSDPSLSVLVLRQTDYQKGGHRGELTFLTESGYLLLVKIFDDPMAWQVQRRLVNIYFRAQETARHPRAGLPEVISLPDRIALGVLRGEGTQEQVFEVMSHIEGILTEAMVVSRIRLRGERAQRQTGIAYLRLLNKMAETSDDLAVRRQHCGAVKFLREKTLEMLETAEKFANDPRYQD